MLYFLTGCVPKIFDEWYVLLPSGDLCTGNTKRLGVSCKIRCISHIKRKSIWSDTLPYIMMAKPSIVLWFTYQPYYKVSYNLTEHLKFQCIQKALDNAHKEREFYRHICHTSVLSWDVFSSGNLAETMKYALFAQQLCYPVNAQQAGLEDSMKV